MMKIDRNRIGGRSQASHASSKTQIVRQKHLPAKDYLLTKGVKLPRPIELGPDLKPDSLPPRGWRKDVNRKKVPIYQACTREVPEIRPLPSSHFGFKPPCFMPSVTPIPPSIPPSIVPSINPSLNLESIHPSVHFGAIRSHRAPSSLVADNGSDPDTEFEDRYTADDYIPPEDNYYDLENDCAVAGPANRNAEIPSRMTAHSDATSFMRDDGWYCSRRRRPVTASTQHNRRQKKVWQKFKTFKKHLNKLAASNANSGESGTTIKTLAFV
jgi:hypothetical protein